MRGQFLATLLTWPAVAAHESLHWMVGRWAAEDADLYVTASRPRYDVHEWHPDASWVIVLAAYAPLLVGLVLSGVGLTWALLVGVTPPDSVRGWAIAALGAGWWAVFMTPSPDDIATAQEGLDRARE